MLLVRPVSQLDPELVLRLLLDQFKFTDVPLVLEDLGDCHEDLGRGHQHVRFTRHSGVPDARQHIADWVVDAHVFLPVSRQPTTNSTWSRQGADPAMPSPGSKSGRGRTCACTPGCDRIACTG